MCVLLHVRGSGRWSLGLSHSWVSLEGTGRDREECFYTLGDSALERAVSQGYGCPEVPDSLSPFVLAVKTNYNTLMSSMASPWYGFFSRDWQKGN